MESLTENRLNDIASSAMLQVHERCFSTSLSEFKHTKMRNGPPFGNHWYRPSLTLLLSTN